MRLDGLKVDLWVDWKVDKMVGLMVELKVWQMVVDLGAMRAA